jgi:hypothetical protein
MELHYTRGAGCGIEVSQVFGKEVFWAAAALHKDDQALNHLLDDMAVGFRAPGAPWLRAAMQGCLRNATRYMEDAYQAAPSDMMRKRIMLVNALCEAF